MSVQEIVNLCREKYPNASICDVARVDDWYILTDRNSPKMDFGGMEVLIDPYIGYNTRNNELTRLTLPDLDRLHLWNKYQDASSISFD